MERKQRPLSPHLQIYRLPLAALISITHRATGVFVTLGTVLLVYWLAALAGGAESFGTAHAVLGSWFFGRPILFLWSAALYFHLCNGVRHLVWDAGYGFDLATVDASGAAVLLGTVILTLGTWALVLSGGGV
jgi:succinate dehydrogenase / fumarate reductase, cytochrome b subunit